MTLTGDRRGDDMMAWHTGPQTHHHLFTRIGSQSSSSHQLTSTCNPSTVSCHLQCSTPVISMLQEGSQTTLSNSTKLFVKWKYLNWVNWIRKNMNQNFLSSACCRRENFYLWKFIFYLVWGAYSAASKFPQSISIVLIHMQIILVSHAAWYIGWYHPLILFAS